MAATRASHRQLLALAKPHEQMLGRQVLAEFGRLGRASLAGMRYATNPGQALDALVRPSADHSSRMVEIIRRNTTRTMRTFADAQMQSLGIKPSSELGKAIRRNLVAGADIMAQRSAAQIARRTGSWLTQGAVLWGNGEPEERQAARDWITERFIGGMAERRARIIAQNEVLQAASSAQELAAQTIAKVTGGKVWKVWMSRRDSKVRHSHRQADGQVRRYDETFSIGRDDGGPDDEMRFPRDPRGSDGNVINCRCFLRWSLRKPRST